MGNSGAASQKGGRGSAGRAGARAAEDSIEAQKEELQLEYDTLSTEGKIQMLKEHNQADPDDGIDESLWDHAIENSQKVNVTSESSKGYYIKEFKEYVNMKTALASQTDAVFNNTGSSSSIYKGSKGNIYIITVTNGGTPGGTLKYKLSKLNKY